MKPNKISKYIATFFNVSITVLMLLFALHFIQLIVTRTWEVQETFTEPDRPNDLNNRRIAYLRKNFLPDGVIHLVGDDGYGSTDGNYIKERIYDVNDNLIWQGRGRDRPYEYLSWAESPTNGFEDWRISYFRNIKPDFSRTIEMPVNSERKTKEVWRYEPELDVFVGYRIIGYRIIGYRIKGERIGYIGTGGFTDSKSAVKPFGRFKMFVARVPEDSFSPELLWQTNRGVYEINFEERKVEVIFETVESEINRVYLNNWGFSERKEPKPSKIEYRPMIHYTTRDGRHHLILKNPEQKLTVSVPEDFSDVVNFTATENSIFMRYSGRELMPPKAGFCESRDAWDAYWLEYRSKPRKEWVELYRVDDKGGLDLVNRLDWISPAYPRTRYSYEIARDYLTELSPPLYNLTLYFFGTELNQLDCNGSGMTQSYAQIIKLSRPRYSLLNCILSAAMMAFALWHGWSRRTSLGKLFLWLVLVGAFNIAGLLAYLALNHTPIIKCPACGRRRGLERVDCIRCGAELPMPERRKLDLIFDI